MSSHPSTVYDPQAIEEKWLALWEKEGLFQGVAADSADDSEYLLIAFPYPSGSGLHVGHVESKTAQDILARYYRMNGKEVFFPIGWDAFGLPAENYAIKTGVHPKETTKKAIDTFRRQIKRIGISYDWEAELATSHPGYYQWTQWIFLQLFEKGLAYQAEAPVNWCPSCQTVLANEQVVDGHCERCDHEVIQKEMKQWFFKITDYKEELISGLDQVDWPNATKQQQLNWIGKSDGVRIDFEVVGSDKKIEVFTTAPTNWGASFLVLAPEHKLVEELTTADQKTEVEKYLKKVKSKSESERNKSKEKTGVFTGSYALNHVTGEHIPIWIGDFVLSTVGTGAIQACPGHDQRDFEFAKKYNLPIPRVVVGEDGDTSDIESIDQVVDKTMKGTMVNSDFLNGMDYQEALQKTMDYFQEKGWGERVTTYKLRDWLISRQRYWGAPIPIVYDPEGNPHPVKEEHLPWMLAEDVDFKPTGESPLASSEELKARVEKLYGKGWTPEYDTMDTFVDSSWYYLRYVDARNEDAFASAEQLKKWLPVDMYMIGPEHIVLHLLYSRFFTKALRDLGYLDFDEPFTKMRHQGMILGPDHKKMSKSKGNVINPDDVIDKFGADTLRVYEMFMGPLESDKPWDTSAVAGVYRFLTRIHRLVTEIVLNDVDAETERSVEQKLHQTIKKVGDDIPQLKFNTAIAALMELMNEIESAQKTIGSKNNKSPISVDDAVKLLKLVAPFAPFITDELHQLLLDAIRGKDAERPKSVHLEKWPSWDEQLAAEDSVTIAVQVNGKVRAELEVAADSVDQRDEIIASAKEHQKIMPWLEDKEVRKVIYIPGKILNFVV